MSVPINVGLHTMADAAPWIWNAISGIGAGLFSYAGTSSANRANLKIAREQMEFQKQMIAQQMAYQTQMSNTAYQRAMADMEAAGLNPILAARVGGAGSPAGASGGGAGASMQNEIGPAVSSAIDAARSMAEIQNLRQSFRNAKEQQTKIQRDVSVAEEDWAIKHETAKQLRLLTPAMQNAAKFARSNLGEMTPYLKQAGEAAETAMKLMMLIK